MDYFTEITTSEILGLLGVVLFFGFIGVLGRLTLSWLGRIRFLKKRGLF